MHEFKSSSILYGIGKKLEEVGDFEIERPQDYGGKKGGREKRSNNYKPPAPSALLKNAQKTTKRTSSTPLQVRHFKAKINGSPFNRADLIFVVSIKQQKSSQPYASFTFVIGK